MDQIEKEAILLLHSVEKIDSLWHFYNLLDEPIQQEAYAGIMKWHKPFTAFIYLSLVSNGELAQVTSGQKFEELNSIFGNLFEEVPTSNSSASSKQYQIKDISALSSIGINIEDIPIAIKEVKQYQEMPLIHRSNTLVLLMTRFEDFIASYLKWLFRRFPQKYLDDKTISFSEIKDMNLDEISIRIIEREVDAKMRESYTEWFKIFDSHKIKFDSCKKEMENLKELYMRRNIWVHNSGKVNRTYLSAIPNTQHIIGETLNVDEEYLQSAFTTIKVVILNALVELIRLLPDDGKDNFVEELFRYCYECLENKEYAACSNAFSRFSEIKGIDANYHMMARINYWITVIETKGIGQIETEIREFDVSAHQDKYILAKHLLLQEFEPAYSISDNLLAKGLISGLDIEKFPMYSRFRDTDYYQQLKMKYPKEFDILTVSAAEEMVASGNTEIIEGYKTCPKDIKDILFYPYDFFSAF